MRKRKDDMGKTRQRIVDAAVELHGTIGPAHTTLSAIAEKAGVQRSTLYRHFKDESEIFAACSADWFSSHPWPDMPRATPDDDPLDRLRRGLRELYGYYAANREMLWNVLRDLDSMPPFIAELMYSQVTATRDELLLPWQSDGDHDLLAAVSMAVDFRTWLTLGDAGLDSDNAADLLARMLGCLSPSGAPSDGSAW